MSKYSFVDNNRWWGGIAAFERNEDGLAAEPRKIKDFIPFESWVMVKSFRDKEPRRVKLISAEHADVAVGFERIDSEYLVVMDPEDPDPNRNHPLFKDRYKRICIFDLESIERATETVVVSNDLEEDELF